MTTKLEQTISDLLDEVADLVRRKEAIEQAVELLRTGLPAEPETKPHRNTKYEWTLAETMWKDGSTDEEIAAAIGAPVRTVVTHRTRAGWKEREAAGDGRRTKFDWAKAKRMWLDGKTALEIARELGCSDAGVYYRAKKDGWPERGDGKPPTRHNIDLSKRKRIPVQQCPHCGCMTNVDPCEQCHIYIRPAVNHASRK